MTKKSKIITGVVAALFVIGLIGSLRDDPAPVAAAPLPTITAPAVPTTEPVAEATPARALQEDTQQGDDRPGDPRVYARIASLTDCVALQGEFDTSFNNNQRQNPGTALYATTLAYMSAADDQLKAAKCY